jgi:hypothetical protein
LLFVLLQIANKLGLSNKKKVSAPFGDHLAPEDGRQTGPKYVV